MKKCIDYTQIKLLEVANEFRILKNQKLKE